MNASVKLGGFGAGLVALFAAALLVGSQVGAIGAAPEHGEHAEGGHSAHAEAGQLPGGLMTAQDGYRLVLDRTTLPAGRQPLAFTIAGPKGDAVTAYDKTHERRLHLIAVRRDFTGFQHVHPVLGADGTWRTSLDLRAGSWRVFADFKPADAEGLVLGADLAVPGTTSAAGHAHASRTSVVDGYTVRLAGTLRPGKTSPLTLTVTRNGRPVRDLQPYLGAYGHLVALRDGDLAYLHVHPDEDSGPGPRIEFGAEVPSVGRYHLYLDFKHGGTVRTAHFTLDAGRHHA